MKRLTSTGSEWTGTSTASSTTRRSSFARRPGRSSSFPDLPVSASCVRVPVVVGHAEAVWVETESPLAPEEAERILGDAPGLRVSGVPTHDAAIGADVALVGRIRRDHSTESGLVLFVVCDNLRKGAALNAIQIAELAVAARVAS